MRNQEFENCDRMCIRLWVNISNITENARWSNIWLDYARIKPKKVQAWKKGTRDCDAVLSEVVVSGTFFTQQNSDPAVISVCCLFLYKVVRITFDILSIDITLVFFYSGPGYSFFSLYSQQDYSAFMYEKRTERNDAANDSMHRNRVYSYQHR